jgi:ABC-type Na+ efflux pump permease subunit
MPIASLSDNVRSAQSLGGFIQMIPLLIIFYAMYGNINALPPTLELFVKLIPHTYAVLAIDALLKSKWLGVILDIALMMIITLAYLVITMKIFESEYIVTGSISRRRRGG